MNTTDAIAEAMSNWDKLEADARAKFPHATADEIYLIAKTAMDKSLGLNQADGEARKFERTTR